MMAELSVPAPTLLEAIQVGHGISIDPNENPELFFVLDSEMRQKLQDANFREPTDAQLIGTSRCVGLSEFDVRQKWEQMLKGNS